MTMSDKKNNLVHQMALNVHDFKNDQCDDWHNAIQEAIDSAHSQGGGTVILPAATYATSETIVIRENVHLAGKGKVIIQPLGNPGSNGIIKPESNCVLSGITITGVRSDGLIPNCSLFRHRSNEDNLVSNVVVSDCIFRDSSRTGSEGFDAVYLGSGFRDFSFYRCQFIAGGRHNLAIISGKGAFFYNCFFGGDYQYLNIDIEPNPGDTLLSNIVLQDCVIDCTQTNAHEKSLRIQLPITTHVTLDRVSVLGGSIIIQNINHIVINNCIVDDFFIVQDSLEASEITIRDCIFGKALVGKIKNSIVTNTVMNALQLTLKDSTVRDCRVLGAGKNSINIGMVGVSRLVDNRIIAKTNSSSVEYSGSIGFGGASVGSSFIRNHLIVEEGYQDKPFRIRRKNSDIIFEHNYFSKVVHTD